MFDTQVQFQGGTNSPPQPANSNKDILGKKKSYLVQILTKFGIPSKYANIILMIFVAGMLILAVAIYIITVNAREKMVNEPIPSRVNKP